MYSVLLSDLNYESAGFLGKLLSSVEICNCVFSFMKISKLVWIFVSYEYLLDFFTVFF